MKQTIAAQRELLSTEAAAEFVQLAMAYQSKLELESNGHRVNPKSLLGVLCLGISSGASLTLTADGPDAEAAIQKLVEFFSTSFRQEP